MKQYTSILSFVSVFMLLITSVNIQAAEKIEADFVHGITIKVDGKDYQLAGTADGPNGATDIPGHAWVVTDKNELIGKHFNTGPFGANNFWSSTAADGELLYVITGIIDEWSKTKAAAYYNKGFVHYHELIATNDGSKHPNKVIWLRHTATMHFDLDSGPHPALYHHVEPGVDYEFVPNWERPYNPTL